MFAEDFSNVIRRFPTGGNRLFQLNSSHDELAIQLLGKIETRFGREYVDENDIDIMLLSFIGEVSHSLIEFNYALYYLIEGTEFEQCRFEVLRADRIFKFVGNYVQFLPKRVNEEWESSKIEQHREARVLDQSKLLRLRLPNSIGKRISAQNKILATIDAHQFSGKEFFPQVSLEEPNPTNHFDFQVWKDTQDLALYRATRHTGWNTRKWDSSMRSDFFDCYRAIRFRKNQLTVRDSILDQLNKELTRIGKRFETNFYIEIVPTEFLPNMARLNELESGLFLETVRFTDIIEYCYR